MAQRIDLINLQTSTTFSPYIIGVIFGYYFDRMESKEKNLEGISKLRMSFFWIVTFSLILFLLIIYLTSIILLVPDDVAVQVFPFADVVYKLLANICLGWTAMACHFGKGGILNSILSCGFFKIISKLCLGMYLIHCMIIIIIVKMKTKYSTLKIEEMVNMFQNFYTGIVKINHILILLQAPEMAVELGLSMLFAIFLNIFIGGPMNELVSRILNKFSNYTSPTCEGGSAER